MLYRLCPSGSNARICRASSRPGSADMTAGTLSPYEPRRRAGLQPSTRLCVGGAPSFPDPGLGATAHSRCVEVREDPGPHLPPPCKALLHREEGDIVPPVGPLLGLFPRGKKVAMFADATPAGLNR